MLTAEHRRSDGGRWSVEHWRFLGLMLIPTSLIALGRVHGLPTADFLDRHLALTATPRGLQHTVQDVLLVPLGALVVVFFSSAVPYTLEVAALGRLRPETYGILVSLEPAFGAIAGFLLLGQALEQPELVAIALVSMASIGASLTARPARGMPGELGA